MFPGYSSFSNPNDKYPHVRFSWPGYWCNETDAVTQNYAVLGHGSFLRVIEPDVPMEPSDPGLNGMPALSNVYPPTLRGDVYAKCFQAEVTFVGRRELV